MARDECLGYYGYHVSLVTVWAVGMRWVRGEYRAVPASSMDPRLSAHGVTRIRGPQLDARLA